MTIKDVIMLDGCPHCRNGVPAIVTVMEWTTPKETEFIGDDWTKELIDACMNYPTLRIMRCQPILE